MGKIIRKTMDEILQDREGSDRRLAALADLPDEDIGLSDIPEATEEFWQNARPFGEVMEERRARRAMKVTVAIDADVAAWLERDGGVDAKVNQVLRQVMLEDLQGKQKRA